MTPAEMILELAAAEGVELRVRGGRLTFRGGSRDLAEMLKGHEAAVVDALGGEYRNPLEGPGPLPPVTRMAGRHTTTTERIRR